MHADRHRAGQSDDENHQHAKDSPEHARDVLRVHSRFKRNSPAGVAVPMSRESRPRFMARSLCLASAASKSGVSAGFCLQQGTLAGRARTRAFHPTFPRYRVI
jgi:hypothetical protein